MSYTYHFDAVLTTSTVFPLRLARSYDLFVSVEIKSVSGHILMSSRNGTDYLVA